VVSIHLEGTFGRLRYLLGGDRPSQTACLALSLFLIKGRVRVETKPEWYFTVGSTEPFGPASQPPTYPTQAKSQRNAKLQ
jgi:hypothetical protein